MSAATNDYTYVKKLTASLKMKHIVIFAAIIIGLYVLHALVSFGPGVDRTDYKAVAEHFIENNATIANKLGKITSISHRGIGGSAGSESHNTYRIKGETKTGVCYITLEKNNKGLWAVKTVTLSVDGAEYTIPVSRSSEKREIRLF